MNLLPITYKNKIPIFMYHNVVDELPNDPLIDYTLLTLTHNFEADIVYLKKYYNIIGIDTLDKAVYHDRPSCVITFDDGWLDNYTYAYPVLKKHCVPATIYLTTSFVGSSDLMWFDRVRIIICELTIDDLVIKYFNTKYNIELESSNCSDINKYMLWSCLVNLFKSMHPEQISEQINLILSEMGIPFGKVFSRKFLNWEEIEEMGKNDISFGSHCVNHSILTNLTSLEKKNEISLSKEILINKNINLSNSISFPNGSYDQEILNLSFEAGYKYLLSASYNRCGTGSSSRLIHRIGITHSMSNNNYKLRLALFKAMLKRKLPDARHLAAGRE